MTLVKDKFGITILALYIVFGVWQWDMYSLWRKYFENKLLWGHNLRRTTVNRLRGSTAESSVGNELIGCHTSVTKLYVLYFLRGISFTEHPQTSATHRPVPR